LIAAAAAAAVDGAGMQHDVGTTVANAKDILELGSLSYSLEQVVDQEWVAQIKASYVPVQVSNCIPSASYEACSGQQL
jgi:ribosomal protein L11 methylase PrmA